MYCMSAGSKHSNAHSLIIKFKSPPNCVQFSFLINIPHCRCTKVKIELFGNLKEISMIFQETFFAGAKGIGGEAPYRIFWPFFASQDALEVMGVSHSLTHGQPT